MLVQEAAAVGRTRTHYLTCKSHLFIVNSHGHNWKKGVEYKDVSGGFFLLTYLGLVSQTSYSEATYCVFNCWVTF